jgi:VCBS repeat-containing protein
MALPKGIRVSVANTPQAKDDIYTFGEGDSTLQVLDVLANDLGGEAKTLYSVNQADLLVAWSTWYVLSSGAKVRITDDGKIEYDFSAIDLALIESLDDGEQYVDTFNYAIRLSNGAISTASATLTFYGLNDAPVANGDSATATEDVALAAASVLGNDTDPDGEDLDVAAVKVGSTTIVDGGAGDTDGLVNGSITFGTLAGGTVTFNLEDGTFSYNQNGAFNSLTTGENGADSFQYQITDGDAPSGFATVNITINGVNDTPDAVADSATVNEDATTANLRASLLSNDTDPDSGETATLKITAVTQGAKGSVVLSDNGTPLDFSDDVVTYSADGNVLDALAVGQSTTDTFTYTVTDAQGATDTASVTVTINGVNDAPVLDPSKTPAATAVLEDAGAPVGAVGTLVSQLVNVNPPAGGLDNVSDADSGALTGIALTATDSTNGTWFYSTNNGGTWTAVGAVSNVSALLLAADANTRLYFQPTADYDGEADITFRAWDQTTGLATAKVSTAANGGTTAFSAATDVATFDVTPVADGPVAIGDNVITNVGVGTAIPILEWALLANDPVSAIDVSGASGAIGGTVLHLPGSGTNGTVNFTDSAPDGGSFTYTATDGANVGPAATVTVTQDISGNLDGTAGADILVGQSGGGGSIMIGGAGNDILLGANSSDIYQFGMSDGADIISDISGNDAIEISTNPPIDSSSITTLNFERVGNDLIIDVGTTEITIKGHYSGNAIEDISFTNGGTAYGYTLSTTVYKLSTDSMSPLTEPGNTTDVIASSSGAETLNGGGGNDLLFGNNGSDTIFGDNGRDLLVGGGSSDTFDFNATNESGTSTATADVIADFVHGTDKIDVSGIDPISGGPDNAFTFNVATPTNNGIWYTEGAGLTLVHFDTNGNNATDEMLIILTGTGLGLAATDFVL